MTISKSYPLVSDLFRTAFTVPVRFCVAALLSLMLSVTGASAQAVVTVSPEMSQTLNAGESLTLTATAAPASEGPFTFTWDIGNPAVGITSTGENTATFIITAADNAMSVTDLQISLQVGTSSSETPVMATVPSVAVVAASNQAPTAVITNSTRTDVGGGVTVTFDGSGSFDPDGDTLTYAWSLISGSGITLTGADTASVSFTTPKQIATQQTFAIQLIVTDNGSPALSSPAFTTLANITVAALALNSQPVADAGPDQTVEVGESITLDGSGSTDPDGDTLTYTWTQTDGPDVLAAGTFTSSEMSPTVPLTNPDLAGGAVLVFSLAVTDPDDSTATDTVTITIADPNADTQKTVESINRFMQTRTKLILANQPKAARRINRLQQGAGTEQLAFTQGDLAAVTPFDFNFLSLGSGTYKFATSLDQVTRAANTMILVGAADTGANTADTGTATTEHTRRRFDMWFEGSLHKVNGSGGSDGTFGIAHLGADYLVSPDLLVGGVLQYDSLTDSNSSDNSRIEGKGWMVGPYITARLQEYLYLDARVAGGTSDNDIRPPGATYTDSFTSTRWLADIGLTGDFTHDNWSLRPNVSLSYMADRQKAYTNTPGGSIPSQTVSQGQFKAGPTISRQFLGGNGWRYEPKLTLDAIYSHANTSGVTVSTAGVEDGWRARIAPGLSMTGPDGLGLSLTGTYDGIGQSDFESWGLGLNLDMKF